MMIDSREKFIQYFESLRDDFENVARSALLRGKESNVQIEIIMQASKGSVLQQTRLKPDNPLYKTVEAMAATLRTETDKWKKSIDAFEKSDNFRGKHSCSLMVYVYGKVKSGKSSLLNYLAHGYTNPTQEQIASDVQVFFQDDSGKYDSQKNELEEKRRMRVDYAEATSAIQGYILPGITLVDSPGIHSMTPENGALAQEYLQSADIIIYATSSKSSTRASDIKELLEIVQSGKTFFIVSTAADTLDEDEDEDGNIVTKLVMLPDHDQKEVCMYCVDQLLHGDTEKRLKKEELQEHVIAISALYAEENATTEGWRKSGMQALLAQVHKVAKSQGIQIKQHTPLKNLQNYNSALLDSLTTLEAAISVNHEWIAKTIEDISRHKECEVDSAVLHLTEAIEGLQECAKGKDKDFAKAVHEIGEKFLHKARLNILSAFMENVQNQLALVGTHNTFHVELPMIDDVYREIEYQSTRKKRGGRLLGTLAGIAIGLVCASNPAGWAAGAAAYAAAGAAAGGFVGSQVGKALDGTSTGKARVGDNADDVRRAAVEKLEVVIKEDLSHTVEGINKECILPLVEWLDSLQNNVSSLRSIITRQQKEIDLEISK
ncbi:dynamin family protein [Nitratidesulfovibrio sp. 1201_IL3209]|uniref:dynamin family protein n=1 Tax=Nitratidesulfovibrio sp. 1201_IL3209 TaxID=3084053 RepID=UPI002FDB0E58